MKRLLDRVTLVCVDTINQGAALISLKKSMDQCRFAKVKFFTNIPIKEDGIETVLIPEIKSKEEYSRWIIKELYRYFDTDFVLVTQADGWVLDGVAWDDAFMDYSYIGAPWLYFDGRNVGNGGFSLRSKELQVLLGTDPLIQVVHPEDDVIGRLYRGYLELRGMRFPSDDIADRFSFELREPVCSTFGFHSFFHPPYQPSVVVRRMGAMGDVLALEPVLRWFHNRGYWVYLETSPYFEGLFDGHDFPIKAAREKDQRVPVEYYNLDLSYESVPGKNHTLAYFDFCGIKETPSKPNLKKSGAKLFDKYVVFHISQRPEPYRNIYGVDWGAIRTLFQENGYLCVEIGERPSGDFLYVHTPNMSIMKTIIAHADFFVGIDSGPSNIAVAMDVPSFIFAGSVDLAKIHFDSSGVIPIEVAGACSTPKCWHEKPGTSGQDCRIDKAAPPCTIFKTADVIKTIKQWIGER